MSEFFEDLSGTNLSELHNCEIQDKNGEKIGRLVDAVLVKRHDCMELTKFVVGDSKIVEFLERIGIREDVDPVFPLSVINKVSRSRIQLKVAKDELKSTHVHSDALDDDEHRLEDLRKTPVFDSTGEKIGRVIDIKFDHNKFQLILGDSVITEWAEGVGLQADIDFLIAPDHIQEFTREKITLSKIKTELKSTFMQNLDVFKRNQDTRKQTLDARNSVFFPTYQY